jgi:hypothetical protein
MWKNARNQTQFLGCIQQEVLSKNKPEILHQQTENLHIQLLNQLHCFWSSRKLNKGCTKKVDTDVIKLNKSI